MRLTTGRRVPGDEFNDAFFCVRFLRAANKLPNGDLLSGRVVHPRSKVTN